MEHTTYNVVSRMSEVHYYYMLTLYYSRLAQDNPFAKPLSLWMNVKGGYGILSASSSVWFYIP